MVIWESLEKTKRKQSYSVFNMQSTAEVGVQDAKA